MHPYNYTAEDFKDICKGTCWFEMGYTPTDEGDFFWTQGNSPNPTRTTYPISELTNRQYKINLTDWHLKEQTIENNGDPLCIYYRPPETLALADCNEHRHALCIKDSSKVLVLISFYFPPGGFKNFLF